MVQDCVFARSSEFQFGFQRKNGYSPGFAGSEFGERTGITLVWQVRKKASSFLPTPNPGRFRVWSKNRAKPWFGRFEVRRKASSFLRTPNTGRFGVRRKNRAEPLFGRFGVGRKDRAQPEEKKKEKKIKKEKKWEKK